MRVCIILLINASSCVSFALMQARTKQSESSTHLTPKGCSKSPSSPKPSTSKSSLSKAAPQHGSKNNQQSSQTNKNANLRNNKKNKNNQHNNQHDLIVTIDLVIDLFITETRLVFYSLTQLLLN